MAVECLDRALDKFGAPLYVYHYIVHNTIIVEDFKRRGVVFVDDLDVVPPGSTLVYSAHGVSPDVERQSRSLRLRVLDTTCPLVTKVHREVREFIRLGFTTLFIGHAGHDEVTGILGESERILLITNVHDAETVKVADPERIAYTTQTTLSLDDCRAIVAVLQRRFPGIIGPAVDDICYATQNRQHAVRALAPMTDVAIVIGSSHSSNSQRLAEIARSADIAAYLIDVPEQIDRSWFSNVRTVLLTAGASVSESLVHATIEWFKRELGATVHEQPGKRELVHFAMPHGLEQ